MPDSLSILKALAAGKGAGGLAVKPSASLVASLAKIGAPSKFVMPSSGGAAGTSNDNGGGFWHTVADLIDRPRRAVADTLQGELHIGTGLAEGIVGAVAGRNDVRDRGLSQAGAGLGEALTGIPRGLFSTAKSDQRTTSDIIENEVDRKGKEIQAIGGAKYHDTANNVNPLLKGIAGFAGDVVTDPLTYVPLPVNKGIGALSKLLGGGAKAAEEAVSTGGQAVEKAVQAAGKKTSPIFETGGDEVPSITRGNAPLAITDGSERPFAVNGLGQAERGAGTSSVQAMKEDYDLEQAIGKIPRRITDSKVAATDPVLKPPAEAMVSALSKPSLDASENAVLKSLGPEFAAQISKKRYTYALRSGAVATSTDGKGFAKFASHLGTYAGWNMMKALAKPAQLAAKTAGALTKGGKETALVGLKRATYVWDHTMGAQKLAEGVLDSKGAVMHLDYKGSRIPVSPAQVFQLMHDASPEAAKAVKLALFNPSTAVPPTKIMEAAVLSANGASEEEIAAHLISAGKGHVREGNIPEAQHFLSKPSGAKGVVADVKGGHVTNDTVMAGLLDGLAGPGQQLKLQALATRNAAEYQQRFMGEYLQMSDEIKASITALTNDPERLGDALVAINRPDVAAADIAQRADVNVASPPAAVDQVVQDLPAGAAAVAKSAVSVETAAKAGDDTVKASHIASDAGAELAEQNADEIGPALASTADDVSEATGNAAQQLSTQAYRDVQGRARAFLDPLMKGVNEGRGLEGTGLFHILNAFGSLKRAIGAEHNGQIAALAAAAKPLAEGSKRTTLHEALDTYLTQGTSMNPAVMAQRDGVAALMAQFFPVGGGASTLGSAFHRIGAAGGDGLHWLNGRMASGHYPALQSLQFDEEVAAAAAKAQGITHLEAAMQQLPGLLVGKVDDVPQFLHSLSVMSIRAANEAAIAHSFEKIMSAGAKPLIAKVPTKGMVKVVWEKSSPLAIFTSKDLRADPKALAALQALHGMMTPKGPIQGEWGRFLREVYDPLQNGFKFGVTLPRPGHHVRNIIGNLSMNFMAEGGRFARKSAQDMAKIMAAHDQYDGVDALKFLTSFGADEYKGVGQTMYRVKIGGKSVELNAGDIYGGLKNNGTLATVSDIEGFGDLAARGADEGGEEGSHLLANLSKKLTRGNRVSKQLGRVSEFVDHTGKIQQAAQILRKFEHDGYITAAWGQKIRPASTEELMRMVGERVRQYHPDGQTLTEWERRVGRRLIPFYTWARGAIPALAETALMNPGRATVFTKASYNLAVAAGVNPDSLANPFPDDQIFPSWLQLDPVGPQMKVGGSYFSVAPGVATLDMAHTYQNPTNPLEVGREIIGQVTPLLRTPVEAATGTSLSTGASIKDWSDYIDQQIPGVSQIAGLTGFSPTGSLVGLATGNGLDESRNQRDGNRATNSGKTALSFLTGATLTNLSQPNYQRAGQFEVQDKANQLEQGQATGF